MHMHTYHAVCKCILYAVAESDPEREGGTDRRATVHQLHAACIQHELDDPRILDHPLVVDAIKGLHTHRLRLRGAPTLAHAERAPVYCTCRSGVGAGW